MQSASFAILSGAELVGRAERLRERRGCSLLMINWVVTGRGRRDLMVCTSEGGERCAGIEEPKCSRVGSTGDSPSEDGESMQMEKRRMTALYALVVHLMFHRRMVKKL